MSPLRRRRGSVMDRIASQPEMAEFDSNDPRFKTDAFMVYGFKVAPCRRMRRHDWRECPYAHTGEVARRRDPLTHSYVGIICPDAKQNSPCPRGDQCPYTHSLFEYWLHPTRYKTEFCSRGRQCTRPFCFFAHSEAEMRAVDTKALLAVSMSSQVDTKTTTTAPAISNAPPPQSLTPAYLPFDDTVIRTADWLRSTSFFDPMPLRSQLLAERSLMRRNGPYGLNHSDLPSLRTQNSSPLLTSQTSSLATPWDTIYENGHLAAMDHTTPLDSHRPYSTPDATNASDVITRLGLGYLQQSAKQKRLCQPTGNGLSIGGRGGGLLAASSAITMTPSLDAARIGMTDFEGIYSGMDSHNRDASLLPLNADVHLLKTLDAERGRSLPTTLPQSPEYFY